jgi:hypothetical protein
MNEMSSVISGCKDRENSYELQVTSKQVCAEGAAYFHFGKYKENNG